MNRKIPYIAIGVVILIVGIFLSRSHLAKVVPGAPKSPAPEPTYAKVATYRVPILMYHYIRVADPADTLGVALSVTPQNFDNQMKWLKDNNFESMKLADLTDPDRKVISQIIGQNKKPVIVTFDDGYDNAATIATPTLKKYGFIGTFFIIRDFVGRPEYATQAQIDEMVANGMEIGSHTLDHLDLSKISLDRAKKQIVDSKLTAETFCYPSGKYTPEVVNLVKEAGYVAAVTTHPGVANQDSDLFQLPRVRIENISIEAFAQKFQGI